MLRASRRQCCGSLLESQLVRRLRQKDREYEASLGYVVMGGGGGKKDENGKEGEEREGGGEEGGGEEGEGNGEGKGWERMTEGK